jgi:hypothetical protein
MDETKETKKNRRTRSNVALKVCFFELKIQETNREYINIDEFDER